MNSELSSPPSSPDLAQDAAETADASPTAPQAKAASQGLMKRVLAMVLFAVLLYGAFTVYRGAGQIADALASFRWWAFFVACALAFGNYMLRFLKWEFYLAKLGVRDVPKRESLLIFLSGFVLTVTPGKVGEVFKSALLAERHGVPMVRTAPIVIADRVTDVIGIALLIAAGSLGFDGGLVWALIGLGMVLVLLLFVSSHTLSLGLLRLLERGPGVVRKLVPKLREAYESLALLVSSRNLVAPTLLSVVAWMLECLSLWVIVQGFGEETSAALCTFFYATSTLAGAIIPTPGGLGVTEGALYEQLTKIAHVSEGTATASMILVRFATLWFAVLVGFVALSLLRTRKTR